MTDLSWVLEVVESTGIRGECAFVGGSVARGWGNPGSDVDVYVFGAAVDTAELAVGTEGRPSVDVHALSTDSVRRLLDLVSWDVIRSGEDHFNRLSDRQWLMLERLHHASPLSGFDVLADHQRRVAASAHRYMLVQEHFGFADAYLEDALGQLQIADDDTAVLSSQIAYLRALDGLLSARGCFAWNPKWRPRAMQETRPDLVPYDAFWRVATMAELPARGRRAWAFDRVADARDIMSRVDTLDFG